MAATSTMLALGTDAPDFALPDVRTGRILRLADFDHRKALLVMFICRHCPYVGHVRKGLARLGRDYADADVGIVAISSRASGSSSTTRQRAGPPGAGAARAPRAVLEALGRDTPSTGNLMRTVVPRPGADSMSIWPPWRATMP